MTTGKAAAVAVVLPCLAYAAVTALTERICTDTAVPSGKERRAARAIRDNVTPFQKWGSRQFTSPYLERYYGAAWYFTQSETDDCKGPFLAALAAALERYADVDLYLLAHHNHLQYWVAELPPGPRTHLRLAYNTGCRDAGQGPAWLKLGARAYVGHPGASASPVFYVYFLRRWTRGAILRDAVDESNSLMQRTLDRAAAVSFGALDADRVGRDSEAFCYGDERLRFAGGRD
jgi:hypothetical protein